MPQETERPAPERMIMFDLPPRKVNRGWLRSKFVELGGVDDVVVVGGVLMR